MITLVDNDKLIKNDKGNAKLFNNFFFNTVKNLKIPGYTNIDQLSECVRNLMLKAIVKYKQYLGIGAIKQKCSFKRRFRFSFIEK